MCGAMVLFVSDHVSGAVVLLVSDSEWDSGVIGE